MDSKWIYRADDRAQPWKLKLINVTTYKGIEMETRLLYISFNQCLRFLVLKTQKLRFGDVRFKFRGCILLGSKVYLIVKLFWNWPSCGAILQISNCTKWKIAIAVVNKKCSFLTEMTSSSYFFIIWTWHDIFSFKNIIT